MAVERKLKQGELLRSVAIPFTPGCLSTQVWALPPAARVIKRTRIRISARPKDSSPLDWLHTDALERKIKEDYWNHNEMLKKMSKSYILDKYLDAVWDSDLITML